jgi:hypothetical protein
MSSRPTPAHQRKRPKHILLIAIPSGDLRDGSRSFHNYVTPLHSAVHVGKKRAFRGNREASFIYACARDLLKRGEGIGCDSVEF